MVRKSEILHFLQSLYAVFEDLLGFSNCKVGVLQVALTCSITVVASIIFALCLSPFFCFYHALNMYLKLRIGSDYAGLLTGQDSAMECESKKLVVNLVVVINRGVPFEDFMECVRRCMERGQSSCKKLTYLVHGCLGYYYFTRGSLKVDDYLSVINYDDEEFITKDVLHNFLMDNCLDERLLKNRMWHVTMFEQPIKWSRCQNTPQHAFVCTVRHSLCDGISILGLLKNKVFREMEVRTVGTKDDEDAAVEGRRHVYKNCFLPHDTNARIKPNFPGGEFLAFFVEETVGYAPLVREVKEKLRVRFSDVLVAAIASAITSYARKKKIKLRKHIGSVAISPFLSKNKHLLSGDFDFDNVSNSNGVLHFNLPEDPLTSMVQKTLIVHETSRRALKASEVTVSQVLTKLFYLVPTPLLSGFLDGETEPACFELSNMSAVESCVIGSNSLESAVFFTTQFFKVGFLFAVITIGDRFQVSLKSDKGMVESQGELHEILKDVFHYLDELNEEVRFLSAREDKIK